MKIDLTKIPPEGKELDFMLPTEWWKPDSDDDRIVGLERPLSTSLRMYPAGKKMVVEGYISTRLLLRCDRCLEQYGWDLSAEFRISLSLSPFQGEGEVELQEDDLNLDFTDGNLLDPDQVIREQLILRVPMKTLCTPECKGLCRVCGCNLNISTCSCPVADRQVLFNQ
ncbi:MAG: hypothetical protein DRG87_00605 [Deltaproteobacteria bacterium]|nr:MAG: hypothetical protein DRG87_00605 [Deltaproteobacteria bacterium]